MSGPPFVIIFTVSKLVKALAVGSAYVVAQTANGIKASCLVRVSPSEAPANSLSLWTGGAAAPATVYGWPGSTVALEVRSSDAKPHTYFWNSSSLYTTVDEGLVRFGWGDDPMDAYAWYCEAVVSVSSEDGCTTSANAVSSLGESFRFGAASEKIGSDVAMLSGKSAEIALMYYDGTAFTAVPEGDMATHSSVPAWKIPRTEEHGCQATVRGATKSDTTKHTHNTS